MVLVTVLYSWSAPPDSFYMEKLKLPAFAKLWSLVQSCGSHIHNFDFVLFKGAAWDK